MKRLLSLMLICLAGFARLTAENILFYDSKQLTCDLVTSICQDEEMGEAQFLEGVICVK